jgi:hypothetical protein
MSVEGMALSNKVFSKNAGQRMTWLKPINRLDGLNPVQFFQSPLILDVPGIQDTLRFNNHHVTLSRSAGFMLNSFRNHDHITGPHFLDTRSEVHFKIT